jgi:hypothetical protein
MGFWKTAADGASDALDRVERVADRANQAVNWIHRAYAYTLTLALAFGGPILMLVLGGQAGNTVVAGIGLVLLVALLVLLVKFGPTQLIGWTASAVLILIFGPLILTPPVLLVALGVKERNIGVLAGGLAVAGIEALLFRVWLRRRRRKEQELQAYYARAEAAQRGPAPLTASLGDAPPKS